MASRFSVSSLLRQIGMSVPYLSNISPSLLEVSFALHFVCRLLYAYLQQRLIKLDV